MVMSEKLLQAWEAVKAVGEGKEAEWRREHWTYWCSLCPDSSAPILDNNVLFRLKPKPRRVKLDGVGVSYLVDAIRYRSSGTVDIETVSLLTEELAALLADRIANKCHDGASFAVNPDGKTATCTFTVELEPEE